MQRNLDPPVEGSNPSSVANPPKAIKAIKAMKTAEAPHHTILFHIAASTLLHLPPQKIQNLWEEIECTMNGDGLYPNASKETLLAAYFEQHKENPETTWVELIQKILQENPQT